ncbi:MAG: DUF4446 family protein [Acetatifactor sp.]|nr:DUF4446 family protein [Acetatifactor sp.]
MADVWTGYLFLSLCALAIITLIFIIVVFAQMGNIKKLKKRIDKLTAGGDGKSLETNIVSLFEDVKMLKGTAEKNRKDIRQIYKNLEGTFQKMGLVKYDAFNQMGGKLSFSLALLDENDNGFIINSVHSTDGCYSYTKEIKNGESSIDLGKEEAQALAIAKGGQN